ncbi:MAG: FKBP-type peptidyl-prolyl cis-trans isomerase [Muribaculaceae bacterium]|nr:FKBP-type peptidyl-prolyl cis-trans isomerase [Muribaculaceae bacterium]
MNKFLTGACALLVAGAFASCGNKCETTENNEANKELSTSYGNYVGAMLNSDFSHFNGEEALDKNKFLEGMQIVLGANADRETLAGMQVAVQMLGEMQQLEENGVKMNKLDVVNSFRKTFKNDSLSPEEAQMYGANFQSLYREALLGAREAAVAKAESENGVPGADNVRAGAEYVAKAKAEDASIVTLPSGLSYKVITPGSSDKPSETSTVTVKYEGRHLNGDVFDSNDKVDFNLQGVVPGFREGIMQIGKGGKATLYIPGELAYGANGIPGTIAPNEMLVFDVEVLDFE